MAAFDPDAFLAGGAAPAAPAFDPDAFLKNAADPNAPSATETKLTADTLRALLNARQGGSYTERMTDWLIPGVKNVIGGATSAAGGLIPGSEGTFGERWRAGVNAEKQFREQNRQETKGALGTAADVVGLLGSMGRTGPGTVAAAAAPTVTTGTRVGSGVLNAAKVGGAQGAVSGAAEEAQDTGSAIRGGIAGGATGAATGAILQGLLGRLASKGAEAERSALRGPSPEGYLDQASQLFKQLDRAGIQFDQGQARRLGGALPQVLKDANYTPTSAPELKDALKAVYEAGAKGAPPLTFTELQALRGKVSAVAQSDPSNANLRRIVGRVTGMIDNFVQNNAPNVNPGGANLAMLYPEARKLWRTGLLGDTVQDVERVAALKAAKPGGASNTADIERQALAAQAVKDIKSGTSQLPAAAQEARQTAIEGTRGQRILDEIAKGSGNWTVNAAIGGGLGSMIGSATGLPIGVTGPAAAAIGAGTGKVIGSVAKRQADRIAADNMDTLVRAIMTGSKAAPTSWDMPRDMLARLLANKAAQSAGGQAAAGTVVPRLMED